MLVLKLQTDPATHGLSYSPLPSGPCLSRGWPVCSPAVPFRLAFRSPQQPALQQAPLPYTATIHSSLRPAKALALFNITQYHYQGCKKAAVFPFAGSIINLLLGAGGVLITQLELYCIITVQDYVGRGIPPKYAL